jgi:hypothetical protein
MSEEREITVDRTPDIDRDLESLENVVNGLNRLIGQLREKNCGVRLYEAMDAFQIFYVPEVMLSLTNPPFDSYMMTNTKKITVEKEK